VVRWFQFSVGILLPPDRLTREPFLTHLFRHSMNTPRWLENFLKERWLECQLFFNPAPWKRGSVFHSMAQHPGIWIPGVILHLIVIWWCGRKYGVPLVFWHHQPLVALLAGAVTALTFGFFFFVFFFLDYSAEIAPSDAEEEADRPGSGGRGKHWTSALAKHFEELHPNGAPDPGHEAALGEKEKFLRELEKQSFLFRSLTNAFAYLISAMFLLRIAIYFLDDRGWKADGQAGSSHGSFNVWQESVRLHDPAWWSFVGGMLAGAALVLLLDLAKFGLLRRDKLKFIDPIHLLQQFNRNLKRKPETAMSILGFWAFLLLLLAHAGVQGAGELFGLYPAAPALTIMLAWWVLIYGAAMFVLRRFPLLAVLPFVVLGALLPFLPAFPVRYGFSHLKGELPAERPLSTLCSIFPRTGEKNHPPEAQRAERKDQQAGFDRNIAQGRIFEQRDLAADWSRGPLVVVCASGGGITAEVWTVEMLSLLSSVLQNFAPNVRLITGASGGMVGAAAWAGHQVSPFPDPPMPLTERCYQDQLSPLIVRHALFDSSPIAFFLQRFWQPARHWDRGEVLEDVWTKTGKPRLGYLPELSRSFSDLRKGEAAGTLPSLIFSPTIAEQGRPLLISNLELSRLTEICLPGPNDEERRDLVHRAVNARDLLGHEIVEQTPFSTWCRMSATFPLVSPPGCLDYDVATRPGVRGRLHLVDAAYVDNQGTSLALAWLKQYWLPWAKSAATGKNRPPSDVILIELDAFPRYSTSAWSDPPQPIPGLRAIQDGLEDLAVPLNGLGNRGKSHLFHTDRMLQDFGAEVNQHQNLRFSCYRFVNPIPSSLSWYLSPGEREGLHWLNRIFLEMKAQSQNPKTLDRIGRRENGTFTPETLDVIHAASANFKGKAPIDVQKDDFLVYSIREFAELVAYWKKHPR
jgi:hypothetical protein